MIKVNEKYLSIGIIVILEIMALKYILLNWSEYMDGYSIYILTMVLGAGIGTTIIFIFAHVIKVNVGSTMMCIAYFEVLYIFVCVLIAVFVTNDFYDVSATISLITLFVVYDGVIGSVLMTMEYKGEVEVE